jgi:hypothetical protein
VTETVSQPEAESPEIQEDDSFEGVTKRYETAQRIIEEIKHQNEHGIEGRSSLADVTGNLQATVGPDLRYYAEDQDPEDLNEALKGIRALEAYFEALGNGDILEGELTEAGADPALREQADEIAAERRESAVQIYAHLLAEKTRQANEATNTQ